MDRPSFRFLLKGVVLKNSGSWLKSHTYGGLRDTTTLCFPFGGKLRNQPCFTMFLRGVLMFNQPAKQGLWLVLTVTGDEPAARRGRKQVLASLGY